MGLPIDKERFSEDDYAAFDAKLGADVEALGRVLARPGFGAGPVSIGAELELHLIDDRAEPSPVNRAVLDAAKDPRVTLEVDRFNLEINSPPTLLEGRPFTALEQELQSALAGVRRAAAVHGARPVMIGILPTLTPAHLLPEALSEGHRYRALSHGIQRLRHQPFPLRIEGEDVLDVAAPDVTYEGANTSFQLHLRVRPEDYARTYNAAQLAIAPVLAVSTNSPFFFGKRLWDETRIALFRQSVDDRPDVTEDDFRPARVSFGHGWVRQGAFELFAESVALHEPLLPVTGAEDPLAVVAAGGVPELAELRLHHGTVWRWNRAVYDPTGGGHLRIELRALPSGPTIADMMASSAFLLGLTLALAPGSDRLVTQLTFGQARRNFYEAARHGPDARLLWPDSTGRVRLVEASSLALSLLPLSRQALLLAGVAEAEVDARLAVVAERARSRLTGARWLRRELARRQRGASWQEAGAELLLAYQKESERGDPVHAWG